MKSFKQMIAEVAQPKSEDELNFKDKHEIEMMDHPESEEHQHTSDKKKAKRLADYDKGEDMAVYEEKKLDPVNPKELKKDFKDREDKDINNDGVVDSSDEYLHNRRKAIKAAMKKEAKEYAPGRIGDIQKMMDKEREAKKAMKKEEAEQIDEISRDLARSYIRKAMANKTTGETPKKDRSSGVNLAGKKAYDIGGKAKVSATESVEELDEISKKTLSSYINKAAADAVTKAYKAGDTSDSKSSFNSHLKALQRQVGIGQATKKLTKEEVELNEMKATDYDSYEDYAKANKAKGVQVIPKALWDNLKKDKKESVELDEISKKTLGSYVKKASDDMANNAYNLGARDPLKDKGSWAKSFKRRAGIAKATDRLTKEEVELDESITRMSDARLKFHATKKVPHGSFSNAEIEDEHDRRNRTSPEYRKAKPSLSEEVDLTENFKQGTVSLKDGSSVLVKKQDADLLNQMFKDLNATNRKRMMDVAMTDRAGFNEILGFAREAL
jgi:hypothetical protein